jgi:hypothetical protein
MGIGVCSATTGSLGAALASVVDSTDGFSSSFSGFFERPVNLRNTDKRLSKTYGADTSLKSWGDFIRSELYQEEAPRMAYYDQFD